MTDSRAVTDLRTHAVTNQPEPLGDLDLWAADTVLREGVAREAGGGSDETLAAFGAEVGRAHWFEEGDRANRNPPVLRTHDRHGRRIDEVEYHPAYHALMALAIRHGVQSLAWRQPGDGGQVAHAAALYLLTQPEQGVCCPVVMTHAAVAALRHAPNLAAVWEPRILADRYDTARRPVGDKAGVTLGMAMTEKQGGSDVRANTTRAEADGDAFRLTGHKWFCSAPMSDGFLTLAQCPEGLTCFLVPRWLPDGERNRFFIQRLKEKCGNRSNASAEIEYDRTLAYRVGEPGRGVATIIDMVQQTRLDAATAPVGMVRQALVQALHHCAARRAFGRPLLEQPLMRRVLADLALEVESGTALVLRVAGAFDRGHSDATERSFARLATAVAKYWTNKRTPLAIHEAMECLGGGGYVEESILARLYREAPVNGIWEGSGNVICLDVLRAAARDAQALDAVREECEAARGAHPALDGHLDRLGRELADPDDLEGRARRITEALALALQGSLLARHAPNAVADAFCRARLGGEGGFTYGTLPDDAATKLLLARAGAPFVQTDAAGTCSRK